jgi:hypothetical protein
MRCLICAQIVLAPATLLVKIDMAVQTRTRALGFPLGALLFCAVSFVRHSLCREFSDVLLLAQEAIALGFGYDHMADTRQSGNKRAPDGAPDLYNRNAQVNGRFFDFESALSRRGTCVLVLMMRTPIRPLNLIQLMLFSGVGGTIWSLVSRSASAPRVVFKRHSEVIAFHPKFRIRDGAEF